MLECFHPNYTLLDRARANQLPNLCEYLVEKAIPASGLVPEANGEAQGVSDMEIDPETGMNMNASNNQPVDGEGINAVVTQLSENTKL